MTEDIVLIRLLSSADRRTVAGVDDAIARVERDPSLFRVLVRGVGNKSDVVRMRCADAIEKLSRTHAEWLKPHRAALLRAARVPQPEIRWHMAQLMPRMGLTPAQRAEAYEILLDYLADKSSIVKTFAMQGLADLSEQDPRLLKRTMPLLEKLARTGTPAMRARGKRLLARHQPL